MFNGFFCVCVCVFYLVHSVGEYIECKQTHGMNNIEQRFSNFFQVGTTFISQNVLRTTLLLSPLKANLSFF
jgi:hypothetical protein